MLCNLVFFYCFFVDPNAPDLCYNQPKFIVFYEMLLKIFFLFCFNCKAANPQVTIQQHGTMVTVKQQCMKCIRGYVWNSQSFMPHGKYPAGNVLLTLAVLMAGASVSKVLLVLRQVLHGPSFHTNCDSFSQLCSTTGRHTELVSSVSSRTWEMWFGPEMGGLTPWDNFSQKWSLHNVFIHHNDNCAF